jgi:putative transcriptional regulator
LDAEANMKKTSKAGSRVLQGAKEALAFARGKGNVKNYRVHIPADALPDSERDERRIGDRSSQLLAPRRRKAR